MLGNGACVGAPVEERQITGSVRLKSAEPQCKKIEEDQGGVVNRPKKNFASAAHPASQDVSYAALETTALSKIPPGSGLLTRREFASQAMRKPTSRS
jgi:hypothetical protein